MRRFTVFLLALVLGWAAGAAVPVLVVGHKNPDTDCIVAAIAVAHLKGCQGVPAEAAAQGPPPPETRFALETFRLQAPPVVTSVKGRRVILVDHSDLLQAPADLAQAELVGLVDHHTLGSLGPRPPFEAWVYPAGSVCTVVNRMYAAAGVLVPAPIAGGMLCAILSDTVIFKSPATTEEDRATAAALARIAGVADIQALGLRLFEAGSQVEGVPASELLQRGLKTYELAGRKIAVGQLELVDTGRLASRHGELLEAMARLKGEGYHSVLLMLTDLRKEGSVILAVSDEPARMAGIAGWVPGLMSRKRQLLPALEKALR